LSDLIQQIKEHLSRKCPPHLFPRVDQFAVARAEAGLGLCIPELLKRCYTEIANGGFGPGRGVLGVAGGFAGDYGNLLGNYHQFVTGFQSTGRGCLLIGGTFVARVRVVDFLPPPADLFRRHLIRSCSFRRITFAQA
jgi:hypothetical protein